MRVVIVGGGIVAAYTANALLKEVPQAQVFIVSNEAYRPYDRIHLCSLVEGSATVDDIALELDGRVRVELNCEITGIDTAAKRVISEEASFAYDYLVIATGSKPREIFDTSALDNATTFRSAGDSFKIAQNIEGKNVVVVGVGPIGIELTDTLIKMKEPRQIYLLSRDTHLYSSDLNPESVEQIQDIFEQDERVTVSFKDALVDTVIENGRITKVITKKGEIEDPFVIFGIGITPNVDFAKEALEVNRGVLVDETMRSSDPYVYAVGEAAEVRSDRVLGGTKCPLGARRSLGGFTAGRVKECTLEADVAVARIAGSQEAVFGFETAVDGLKVGSFLFTDLSSAEYDGCDEANEDVVISSRKEKRIDQYIINNDRLVRFIGINTNLDIMHLKQMMEKGEAIDAAYFYANRVLSERGKLICSCASVHEHDLVAIIKENAVTDFGELKAFSDAGRICGRCKKEVSDLIAATPVDPEEAARLRAEREAAAKEAALAKVRRRIEKFNALHPKNMISAENLDEAMASFDMSADFNRWVSQITATMRLHPDFEPLVKEGVKELNKIPIIWLELADCTGNSEGFIKSAHPEVDELILEYISLDYHELLMAAAGDDSEAALDSVIKNDAGKYILIVEGAVPLGMDGKFLRIGPKGETGLALLQRVAKDAAAILAVGSCALDGGVVAASPNPTGAVGVGEALGRGDIINLPGCPVNPINIVGTLLHYIMFDELPELDGKNRPLWAYSARIHENCERRGHYDAEEFVLEWGDEGAKKGWCLYKMGCKGAYASLNCAQVRFNEGCNWPVGVGHGCFGCGEGKIAFDKYANQRMLEEESSDE